MRWAAPPITGAFLRRSFVIAALFISVPVRGQMIELPPQKKIIVGQPIVETSPLTQVVPDHPNIEIAAGRPNVEVVPPKKIFVGQVTIVAQDDSQSVPLPPA